MNTRNRAMIAPALKSDAGCKESHFTIHNEDKHRTRFICRCSSPFKIKGTHLKCKNHAYADEERNSILYKMSTEQ